MKRFMKWLLSLGLVVGMVACRQADIKQDDDAMTTVFFDAGKADAILMYTDDHAVLIDTGESGYGSVILEYLAELGIKHLDALIITHFDKDHVGGAAEIINGIEVIQVFTTNRSKKSEAYESFVEALEEHSLTASVIVGDIDYEFNIDGMEIRINGPAQEKYNKKDDNNSSLIVYVRYGENSYLFAGDAMDERLEEYLEQYTESVDVLKVPYHGRQLDQLEYLLEVSQPSNAIITCSADDGGDQEVLNTLDAYDIDTYLTYRGMVEIVSDGNTISVSQK